MEFAVGRVTPPVTRPTTAPLHLLLLGVRSHARSPLHIQSPPRHGVDDLRAFFAAAAAAVPPGGAGAFGAVLAHGRRGGARAGDHHQGRGGARVLAAAAVRRAGVGARGGVRAQRLGAARGVGGVRAALRAGPVRAPRVAAAGRRRAARALPPPPLRARLRLPGGRGALRPRRAALRAPRRRRTRLPLLAGRPRRLPLPRGQVPPGRARRRLPPGAGAGPVPPGRDPGAVVQPGAVRVARRLRGQPVPRGAGARGGRRGRRHGAVRCAGRPRLLRADGAAAGRAGRRVRGAVRRPHPLRRQGAHAAQPLHPRQPGPLRALARALAAALRLERRGRGRRRPEDRVSQVGRRGRGALEVPPALRLALARGCAAVVTAVSEYSRYFLLVR